MKEKTYWLREPAEEGFNWTLFWFIATIVFALTWVLSGVMLDGYTAESIRDEMFYGLERAHAVSLWLTGASAVALIIFIAIDIRRHPNIPKDPKII